MKRTIYFLSFALALVFLNSCGNGNAETKNTEETSTGQEMEIPVLLDRSGDVGSPEEASKMSNTFLQLREQIRKNPDNYANRLKMADLYIVEARATGNYGYYYPAAIKMIDGVLADKPENKDDKYRAYSSKAVILLSLHRFDEAREIGEKALAINNHDARVYGILTDANVELGNYDEAVIMADSMVATRPDLRSYSRISYLREIYGEVEGAQEAMMMAVKAGYPGHEETSWSRVTLGNLYETYGDLTRADVQYRTAIQNRRGYPFAIAGLASVEAKKGNMAEATGLLKKAIDIRPEAGFYEQLALLYKQQGDEDNAAKAGEKAMETLKGLSGEHQHDHGDHSHRDGEHTHGQNEHGHSHEVGLEMAKMLVSLQQDYEEALHHGLHEYSRRPDNIEVNKLLAEVYYKTGRIKQASEHYEKAMVTNTKDPKLMMLGGLIKMADGQSAEGKKMILKSFEINPYQTGPIASESKSKIGQGKRSLNT